MRIRKGDQVPVAVYDVKGRLVGVVMNPDKIQAVAGFGAESEPDLTPPPTAEVGSPADAASDGVAKLKKSVYSAPVVAEREQAAETLNAAARVALDLIHGRRPSRGTGPGRGGHAA